MWLLRDANATKLPTFYVCCVFHPCHTCCSVFDERAAHVCARTYSIHRRVYYLIASSLHTEYTLQILWLKQIYICEANKVNRRCVPKYHSENAARTLLNSTQTHTHTHSLVLSLPFRFSLVFGLSHELEMCNFARINSTNTLHVFPSFFFLFVVA